MSTSPPPPCASAPVTHGVTDAAPYTAPVARAPRTRKAPRLMPWISMFSIGFRPFGLGGEERLDGLEHLVGRRRLGERVRGRLRVRGEVEDRRVARLHRVYRQGRGQDLLVLDAPALAEIGAGAEVLDGR